MKHKLLILISIFIIFKINAQITFKDHIIIDDTYSTDGALSVYSADIDGDGDMDVLSASFNDDKIVWYENIDGLGSFGQQQIITNDANGAREVFAIDIDGDGDIDVISASYYQSFDHKVAWYENTDGQGTFGNEQIISTNALGVFSIFASDIDGDGDIDVLSASLIDNKIAWYKNIDGQGNFSSEQIIAINLEQASEVYATDVDGDGDMDVLASNSQVNQRLVWYRNIDGQGNFGPEQILDNTQTLNKIYAADLDNDNDMDIICSSSVSGNSAWYENTDGLGNFSVGKIISKDPYYTSSITAIDFDDDNDVDIVSNYSDGFINGGQIVWYENIDGSGNFSIEKRIFNSSNSSDVFVVDINNDNKVDIISSSISDDEVSWYQNIDNQGNFSLELPISVNANSPRSVYAADIDGDGDKDILSASYEDDKIAWYENMDGLGNFGKQRIITLNAKRANSVFAEDIDGDGDIDVLSASFGDNKIAWYENTDSQGSFGVQQIITIDAIEAFSIFAADMDGDGDIDVLSGSDRGQNPSWYENIDGQGTFSSRQNLTEYIFSSRSIFTADFDGDNDLDVVSANFYSSNAQIHWFENTNGIGKFDGIPKFISGDAFGANSVFATDIDNDGDFDVLSASGSDSKIAWYENTDGLGTFGAQHTISIDVSHARTVFANDIDGDGDMDVISGSLNDNKIAWYENLDGLGSFGVQQIISNNTMGPNSVISTDINGDGKNDVVSSSEFDNKIVWYENTSTLSVNQKSKNDFFIYPNPTNSIIYIDSSVAIKKIELFNIIGKLVLTNYNKNFIDLSTLTQGLYFCKIISNDGFYEIRKIIKR